MNKLALIIQREFLAKVRNKTFIIMRSEERRVGKECR